jgi:hypothetical protein
MRLISKFLRLGDPMRGKLGLFVGLGVGYVLGSRAGRQRYEQIKAGWLKLWHLDPVQEQVTKAKEFAASKAMAIPSAVLGGAVKVVKSATGLGTPGQKLDSTIASGKAAAADVADAVEDAVADAAASAKTASAKKKPSAK